MRWITQLFREAAGRGIMQALADFGLIEPDATAEDVRQAIADKPEEKERKAKKQ